MKRIAEWMLWGAALLCVLLMPETWPIVGAAAAGWLIEKHFRK